MNTKIERSEQVKAMYSYFSNVVQFLTIKLEQRRPKVDMGSCKSLPFGYILALLALCQFISVGVIQAEFGTFIMVI